LPFDLAWGAPLVVVLEEDEEEEGRWVWLGLDCFGGLEVVVFVVLEPEPEVEVVDELELELDELELELEELELEELEVVELVVGVAVEVAVVGEGPGWQDSLSEATGPEMGRPMAEIGVPGATLTLKVSVWPSTSVTVTVQASADAVGRLAINDARIAPASASTSQSLRLLSNVARFLPFAVCKAARLCNIATSQEATDWPRALQRGTVAAQGCGRHKTLNLELSGVP
jgi:hypothetical protein